ncbi:NUDIX hydrolase [Desulfonema magnum]|uniref:NUDIX hydrolase domain-containing protein n=1 Tax=Desulfonema magnum TaxID=45655 RepID=A0A975BFY8_9BACT|nr:CoA pyrophosphatase [Desulfonema magnum]QTA84575.1 NUDIX hydrolase domain-containing protein [Desulfonema magnum]
MKVDSSDLKHIIRNTTPPGPPADMSYQPTCVFLLLYNKDEKSHVLAIQKSDTEGYPWRNQVALPGGHIDKSDPTATDAAFRELEEEVNITRNQVELMGSMGHFQTIKNRDIQVFTGLWNGEGPVRHDPTEIARVLEIPLKKLVRTHDMKNFHGRIPDIYDLKYPFQDVEIWGATARILHHFIELLYPLLDDTSSGDLR